MKSRLRSFQMMPVRKRKKMKVRNSACPGRVLLNAAYFFFHCGTGHTFPSAHCWHHAPRNSHRQVHAHLMNLAYLNSTAVSPVPMLNGDVDA